MSEGEPLYIVANDADVRLFAERGPSAWTRRELHARLLARFVPEIHAASPIALRFVVADVLRALAARESWVRVALERGGNAWLDLVAAMDATLAEAHRMTWYDALAELVDDDPRPRTIAAAALEVERTLLRAGLLHPAAAEARVARALASASPADVVAALGNRRLEATGIAAWLPADLALWRMLDALLAREGGGAVVELAAFERPLDAERPLDPLGRLLDAVAEALDAAPKTRLVTPVLSDLGAAAAMTDDASARVALYEADGARAEARGIARAVHRALAGGAPTDGIAVVLPEGASAHPLIVRWLEELGVAVDRASTPALRAGLVTTALDALLVAARGLPRLALARLLRSRYVDPARIAALSDDAAGRAAVEALIVALEGTRTIPARTPAASLEATAAAASRGTAAETRATSAALARRVGELFTAASSGSSRLEHVGNARRFFEGLGLAAHAGPHAAAYLAGGASRTPLTRAEILAFVSDARGRASLDAALDAYAVAAERVGGGAPLSFEDFCGELVRAVADTATPAAPFASPGAVCVTTLGELSSRPLALLVLADTSGADDDAPSREANLLPPRARARLTEAIEPALRASALASSEASAARLASIVHGAERVVVSYTARDDDGARRPPHRLVASLERQGVRKRAWRGPVVADDPLNAHEERLRRLARASRTEARAIAPHAFERAAIEGLREGRFGLATRGGPNEPTAGLAHEALRSILVEETGGGARAMSVTALDRFATCRFQGFAAQVLRARSRPPVAETIDLREEGVLLHAALAAAFEATRGLWRARPRDEALIRTTTRRITAEVLARDVASTRLVRAALDEIADRVAGVVEWSLADEGWDFERAEAAFGRRGDAWAAVVLEDEGRSTTLRLAGAIDRVDVAHDGRALRILDYKRSEDRARGLMNELGEDSFQLAVYGRAAARELDLPAVAGMYLPTRRLSVAHQTRGADVAWARAHASVDGAPRFERRALEVLGEARAGDVDPHPKDPGACRICDHDGACRKPRFIIAEVSPEDAEGARG